MVEILLIQDKQKLELVEVRNQTTRKPFNHIKIYNLLQHIGCFFRSVVVIFELKIVHSYNYND